MFQNYLKIALRHIDRNRTYVIINVVGLGVAIACCMIAFVNWQTGKNADSFHENYERIFRVTANGVGHTQPTADVSAPLVIRAAEDLKEVAAGIRFHTQGTIVQNETSVFGEQLAFADANFLEVFTFKVISGDANALKDPSQILISEQKAKSYFGDESAIGKTLTLKPGQPNEKQLRIGAVLKNNSTYISSLEFDFLANISLLETAYNTSLQDWRTGLNASFLLLNNPNEQQKVAQALSQYLPIRNKEATWNQRKNFLLEPMDRLFLDGRNTNNNRLARAESPAFYWGMGLLALFILLTACLNFTNTTISFSNKRLKEMGVRKTMGSSRPQLMVQLLGESFFICVLSAVFAIILAEYLTPIYNSLWAFMDVSIKLNYFQNSGLVLFLVGTVLITTLLGGVYPAFYMSSFRPSHIFKGTTRFGGDNWLIRSLLGVQIALSLIAIIGSLTMADNADFQKSHNLGYNVEGIINVDLQGRDQYEKFRTIILENPNIEGVTASSSNLGFSEWDNFVGQPEDQRHASTHVVADNFLNVMNLRLVAGRTFDKNLSTDLTESVLVTQKFVEESNWDHTIGKKIKHRFPNEKNIIGVVEDFYASSFFRKPRAAVFHLSRPEWYSVMKVRVQPEQLATTKQYLEDQWKKHFPLVPFNSYYQDETLATAFTITENIALLYLFLAIVTVLLSATGLFSLVSLNVLKRSKEIAVRRVLGATAENILYSTNKYYLVIFAIGSIVGAVLANWAVHFFLEQIFEVTKGVSLLSIVISVLGLCTIGGLTIGSRLVGVLRTNPAETLKSE
ncbi:MAG: FtsX-like permease family protein [Bacteroidota bacterium]